jgi:hypothetical protein
MCTSQENKNKNFTHRYCCPLIASEFYQPCSFVDVCDTISRWAQFICMPATWPSSSAGPRPIDADPKHVDLCLRIQSGLRSTCKYQIA